jgi:uncharacterized protein YeaC (DUF1315 family)
MMATTQMRRIRTNAGADIGVEADTDERTIAILKSAPVYEYSEFVYTGNHPNGDNHDNGQQEAFVRAAGLWDDRENETEEEDCDGETIEVLSERALLARDYNDSLREQLERMTGIHELKWGKRTLRYHVQAHRGESHMGFGYTWRADYRLIEVV